MPKTAVILFFLFAFLGAAIFVVFTFPIKGRNYWPSKSQVAVGPNLQKLAEQNMSGPGSSSGEAAPERTREPFSLNLVTWGKPEELAAWQSDLTGRAEQAGGSLHVTVLSEDLNGYANLLKQTQTEEGRKKQKFDLIWVNPLDFSGLNPDADLAVLPPLADSEQTPMPLLRHACVSAQAIRAYPAEVAAEVLYFNRAILARTGVAEPGRHWTLDFLQSICHLIDSQGYVDLQGQTIAGVEIETSFMLWNTLSAEAGGAVLDETGWHLGDPDRKAAQLRGLDFLSTYFHELKITSPSGFFGQGRAGFAIGSSASEASLIEPLLARGAGQVRPSSEAADLAPDPVGEVPFPQDLFFRPSVVIGAWGLSRDCSQREVALNFLKNYLLQVPCHSSWFSALPPVLRDSSVERGPARLSADRFRAWREISESLFIPEFPEDQKSLPNEAIMSMLGKVLQQFVYGAPPHPAKEQVYAQLLMAAKTAGLVLPLKP